jgi:flagellar biosynthesis GTPase FlhF
MNASRRSALQNLLASVARRLFAIAMVIVCGAASASAARAEGAFAAGGGPGRSWWGLSLNKTTGAAAQAVAMKYCRERGDCMVKMTFRNACFALAYQMRGTGFWAATRPTVADAQNAAMYFCQSRFGYCEIRRSGCDFVDEQQETARKAAEQARVFQGAERRAGEQRQIEDQRRRQAQREAELERQRKDIARQQAEFEQQQREARARQEALERKRQQQIAQARAATENGRAPASIEQKAAPEPPASVGSSSKGSVGRDRTEISPSIPAGARSPQAPTATPSSKGTEPPPVAAVSLRDALAACDKASKNVPQIELPGAKGPVRLDACYRGRDHLVCTMSALRVEAESVSKEYRTIVESNYPTVKDIDAVCKIDPVRLDEHLAKSKTFDARWEVLHTAFVKATDCNNRVIEAVRTVSLPNLPHSAELMQSMLTTIRNAIESVADDQKNVIKLADYITDAQGVMTTIRQIRGGMCSQQTARH